MLKFKIIGLALALVLIAGLVAVASGATGAYFSDTNKGAITGDSGTILVKTTGGTGADGLDFFWDNMLPGVQYSATVTYQNTGNSVQDVWLVFPNKTALSALNSLGNYGAARVTSTDGASFESNCLLDHPVDQGEVSLNSGHTIKMLPQMIRLARNVGPTGNGSMTFTFAYASMLGDADPAGRWPASSGLEGGLFNVYPAPYTGGAVGGYPSNDGAIAGSDNYYIGAADGEGSGLPFQIVATQPGVEPGQAGTYAGF